MNPLPVPPHVAEILPQEKQTGNKIKFVNPNIKNYENNIKHAAELHKNGIPTMKPNTHKGIAIVCGSGPTLKDEAVLLRIKEEVENGAVVIATKAAIGFLAKSGIKVSYGVTMDPGAHIACEEKIPRVKGVTHIVASSSDPATFEYLKDEDVWIFHSATGLAGEVEMYKELFDVDAVMCGGYNVVNRALSAAMFMGFEKVILAGTDCGWREDQDFYVDGKQNRPGVDMSDGGKVEMTDKEGNQLDPIPEGARVWLTRPDMLASGAALARLGQQLGEKRIEFIGDTLPSHLIHKSDSFLKRVADFN